MGYQYKAKGYVELGNIKRWAYMFIDPLAQDRCSETHIVEGDYAVGNDLEKYALKVTRINRESISLPGDQIGKILEEHKSAINGLGPDLALTCLEAGGEETESQVLAGVITNYFPGQTLAQRLSLKTEDGKYVCRNLPGDEIKHILRGLIACLNKVHEQGMVHGNIKPQNIIIMPDDTVRLFDFAIPGLHRDICLQQNPEEAGNKLAWTAPELLMNPAMDASRASDIWSVGIILFQMLRGCHPFEGRSLEEIVRLVQSRDNNKMRLDYLPPSLNQVLDSCLDKNPANRPPTALILSQQIDSASFTKKCLNCGATQNYDAQVCKCGLSYQDQQEAEPSHSPEDWLSHSDLPGEIGVDSQKNIKIKIQPALLADRSDAVSNGKTISLCLVSKDDPGLEDQTRRTLKIKLLPKPVFDLGVSDLNVELDPLEPNKEVSFPLILKKSEAIIEHIEAFIQDKPDLPILVNCKSYNQWIKAPENSIGMLLGLDWSQLEMGRFYDLSLKIHLKNRKKPQYLNKMTLGRDIRLRVMNPPKLHVPPSSPDGKPIPVSTRVYRGTDLRIETLNLVNAGGGELRVRQIQPFWKDADNGHLPDPGSFIQFHVPEEGLLVFDHNEVRYTIQPDKVPVDSASLNLRISYEGKLDGTWKSGTLDRWAVIDCKNLSKGTILAMDFGTTNSCCCVFLKDKKADGLKEYMEPGSAKEDCSIPSVIQYYGPFAPINIGFQPLTGYMWAEQNIFRSFKRPLGNPEIEYWIYPPGEGTIQKNSPETLSTDYIQCLIQKAKDQFGHSFKNHVFTHPSNFSLSKLRAFNRALKKAGLKKYMLLDEATAGALDFINSKEGEYRLAIYDFGGGTIDITYLKVKHSKKSGITVSIIDVDGVPDFGGDDVTEAIQKAAMAQLLENFNATGGEYAILLPNDPDRDNFTANQQKQAQANAQRLWHSSETIKTEGLFEGEVIRTPYPILWVRDLKTKMIEKISLNGTFNINPQNIYREILPRLVESVEILADMVAEDKKEKQAPLHVVLAGRSSKIPLVSQIFEAFKNGEEPFWDQSQEKVDFKNNPSTNTPTLPYDTIELAQRPKAMVARGAALFGAVQADRKKGGKFSVTVDHVNGVNWSRFGVLSRISMTEDEFEEWIPKRRLLTPEPNTIPYDTQNNEHAIFQQPWTFDFDDDGVMDEEVEIYEQIGRGNDAANSTIVGKFTFRLDEHFAPPYPESAGGELRLEITQDLNIHLSARINGEIFHGIQVK